MDVGWLINQPNRASFVMVDSARIELTGLTLSIEVSKDGGAFAPAGGTWGEITKGWYWYLSTAAEADTVGPVAINVTSVGAVQQNLEYTVIQRTTGVTFWPYQVTYLASPVEGVKVWVTPDVAGNEAAIWIGYTDTNGWAKDAVGNDPLIPLGNNYFWKYKPGWKDVDNPDLEVVT